jgi:hypothetical protein
MRAVSTRVAVIAVALLASAVSSGAATAGQTDDGATFMRGVLPTFQRSCQQCRRPGTGAPLSLLTK